MLSTTTSYFPGNTIFSHDGVGSVFGIKHCNFSNCFNLTLEYSESATKIASIIQKSDQCYQKVKFKCISSRLSDFASWTNVKHEYNSYFSEKGKNSTNWLTFDY